MRYEQFLIDAKMPVAVLGRGVEYILVDLDAASDDNITRDAIARGYTWCGCLGIKGGLAGAVVDPHPDSFVTMSVAGLAYANSVAPHLRPPPKGDAVPFLEHLYTLEDPREVR